MKIKLKQILIGIAMLVGVVGLQNSAPALSEEQNPMGDAVLTISLEDSLVKYNVSTTTAKNISDYFDGKGQKFSPGVNGEYNQWLTAFNKAAKDLNIKTLGPFKDKSEMLLKMNEIIKQGASKK